MARLKIFWPQLSGAIVLLAAIFGIISFFQKQSCTTSDAERLRRELDYLKKKPTKKVESGQQWIVDHSELHYFKIELDDGAEILLSPKLKTVSIYSQQITIGSNVKITGNGKDGTDGKDGFQPQQSGQCSDGAPGSDGKPGTNGSNGVRVELKTLEIDFQGKPLIVDLSGGDGGCGGKGGKGGKGGEASTSINCGGGDGGTSGNGGNAGNGGDGGNLSIKYIVAKHNTQPIENTGLRSIIQFNSEAGTKGIPGDLGPIGDEGEGQSAETLNAIFPGLGNLDSEPAGNPGKPGNRGSIGEDGQLGRLELATLRD